MVGILKALHSEISTENNTKAFSVLIAFSGAVWCKSSLWTLNFLSNIRPQLLLLFSSHLCPSLVLLGKEAPRFGSPYGNHLLDCRFQADVCCLPRVYAPETNIYVPRFLFPHASDFNHAPMLLLNICLLRGDVLNTTVYVGAPRYRMTSFPSSG